MLKEKSTFDMVKRHVGRPFKPSKNIITLYDINKIINSHDINIKQSNTSNKLNKSNK